MQNVTKGLLYKSDATSMCEVSGHWEGDLKQELWVLSCNHQTINPEVVFLFYKYQTESVFFRGVLLYLCVIMFRLGLRGVVPKFPAIDNDRINIEKLAFAPISYISHKIHKQNITRYQYSTF